MTRLAIFPQDSQNKLTTRFRLLGILPLAFFIARFFELSQKGVPQDIFWVCHFSNLALALGIFLAIPSVIRASVMWLILGLPLWIWWLVQAGTTDVTSYFTHLGGLVVGLMALAKVHIANKIWLHSFLGFVLLQQFCRWFTPESLNINMSQSLYLAGVYVGGEKFFNVYWQYWMGTILVIALCLWGTERILIKLYPKPEAIKEERGNEP